MQKDSPEYLDAMYRAGYQGPKPGLFQTWRQVFKVGLILIVWTAIGIAAVLYAFGDK